MDEFSKQWSLMGKDSNNLAKIRKFFKNMELPITTQFAKGHDGRQQEWPIWRVERTDSKDKGINLEKFSRTTEQARELKHLTCLGKRLLFQCCWSTRCKANNG